MQIEEIEPNERRQHERRVLRGLSQLQFGKNPAMETRTMDVSISGLGIIAPVNPLCGADRRGPQRHHHGVCGSDPQRVHPR